MSTVLSYRIPFSLVHLFSHFQTHCLMQFSISTIKNSRKLKIASELAVITTKNLTHLHFNLHLVDKKHPTQQHSLTSYNTHTKYKTRLNQINRFFNPFCTGLLKDGTGRQGTLGADVTLKNALILEPFDRF